MIITSIIIVVKIIAYIVLIDYLHTIHKGLKVRESDNQR